MINASKINNRIGFKAEIGIILSLSNRELCEVRNDSKLISETYKVILNSVEKLEIFLDFLESEQEENLKNILEIKVSFVKKAKNIIVQVIFIISNLLIIVIQLIPTLIIL